MKCEKSKKLKWICIISAVLVLTVACSAFVYFQWDNIIALNYALTYSDEKLKKLEYDNNKLINDIFDEFSGSGLTALNDEAVEMLNEGKLTQQQVTDIITGKTTIEEIKALNNNESKKETDDAEKISENNNDVSNSNAQIANLIGQIYVLRATFVGRLDSLIAQGKAELSAGTSSKKELASKYISLGSSLEAQCDSQIEGILSKLKQELSKNGGDLNIISQIRTAYRNEKSAKKAAILSQMR